MLYCMSQQLVQANHSAYFSITPLNDLDISDHADNVLLMVTNFMALNRQFKLRNDIEMSSVEKRGS